MSGLVHHALLGVAMASLLGAGWRVADRAASSGLARALACAVVAASLIVLEALALGIFGAASSSVGLTAAALATYAAAWRLLPAPRIGARAELAAWWAGLGTPARAATGAGVVLFVGWIGWQLRHPLVGYDGLKYHLPLAESWARSGHPGRLVDLVQGIPVASYPVTTEVALSWVVALSHSLVVASVWTPLLALVLVAGAALGLRELRVPPAAAAAAILAFLAEPIALTQLGGVLTDFACAAWLLAAAGLCAAARERPGLLPIALLAAGLSFGTKTTGAVLLLAALIGAAYVSRAALRGLSRWSWLAVPAALLLGGIWATRNLALHGSPLWPFVAAPGGTPVPPLLKGLDQSFLQHPRAVLSGRVDDYLKFMAGGAILIAGGVLAPLAARTRPVLIATVVAFVALLSWGLAPYTGIATETDLAVGGTRYLLPAIGACGLAAVLAARDAGPAVRRLIVAVLWAAAAVSAWRTWAIGFPYVPGVRTVVALVVVGAAAGAALAPLAARVPSAARGVAWRLAPPVTAVLAVVALAASASGYVLRHAATGFSDGGLLHTEAELPDFGGGSYPIAMGPVTNALVGGDHLQHPVVFVGGAAACPVVRAHATGGVVVLERLPVTAAYRHLSSCLAGLRPRWQDANFQIYAG